MAVTFKQIQLLNSVTFTPEMARLAASLLTHQKLSEIPQNPRIEQIIDGGVHIHIPDYFVMIYKDGFGAAINRNTNEHEIPCNQLRWVEHLIEWGFYAVEWVEEKEPEPVDIRTKFIDTCEIF